MSLSIRAKLYCDRCPAVIVGPVQNRRTPGYGKDSYAEAVKQAEALRWLITHRKRGPTLHLCPKCADSAPARPARARKAAKG